MHHGERTDIAKAPTHAIPQARRLRALMPPLTPERASATGQDAEATVALTFGPETIPAHMLGPRAGTGRSPIPLNSHSYMLDREVAAYRNGYADGFVDSITLRPAHP